MQVMGLSIRYDEREVVRDVNLEIPEGKVTAIIGPSGCGKTTFLRCLNRLSELTKGCRVSGRIMMDGQDILKIDPISLRRRVGMVFQKPNPFPMSIRENILYGLKAAGTRHPEPDALVRDCLTKAALWDELGGRLKENAFQLSLGQQQRLCIARCLAISPQTILLDEPASSLDPISATKLSSAILSMKGNYTQVLVTHNLQEARKVSDYVAFMYLGELVEFGTTEQIFDQPREERTVDYVNGRLETEECTV
jgi:phosphate transport system ATP-binding protein